MTNEQLERKMEFIVETLARVSVNDENRQQDYERHERRLDRLERIMKLMVRTGLRERRTRRERDELYDRRFGELLESQVHTDRRLDALIDVVRQQRNGGS